MRPQGIGRFEFVVLASLRASQLTRGCLPRITGDHGVAVTAQLEIACGSVVPVSATGAAAVERAVVDVSEPAET